ncbi:hypothetical protein ACQPW1_15130 [Nocardia sp. CA-128927]|uniref:hypothetical protein n=1 Tax=Nocardia sp. CA-128927 TaxID=3239975 RepID=UPI003D980AA6
MGLSRVAWLLLAGATAGWGAFVASEPLHQISSCEVVQMDTACGDSIFARYGVGLVLLLAVPVVLCALPALRATHGLPWLVAGVLVIGALLALPATDTVFAALVYYLPVGVVATLVAGFQAWYDARSGSTDVAQPASPRSARSESDPGSAW